MIWPPCWNLETQILQPMHSRMSSTRPSEILVGRNGCAAEGGAGPVRPRTPAAVCAPSFAYLGRPEWIRDRGASRADNVQPPGADQRDHVVGAGEAAVADH